MAPIISATDLRKSFGPTVAVDDVSFQIPEREIFGLVGPDGAGKTTIFRLLMGLLRPDAGAATVAGFDPQEQPQAARARVGYVAQTFSLYGELTVDENLRFIAEVRNWPRAEYAARSGEVLELTELAPFTARLARDLSGGMKRKLALACALLTRPRILLLDEPTTGIDPVSRREFWRLLYDLPNEGVTILVSTPYLDEAERCHRLGFMAGGKLLAVDSPAGLRMRMPDTLVEIHTPRRREARALLRERAEVRRVDTIGGALRVAVDPRAPLNECEALAAWLTERSVRVESCALANVTLADVFNALSETGAIA